MAAQMKKAQYRLRVYQDLNGNIDLVFGDGPAALEADGITVQKLLSDRDVTETVESVDHVESAPSSQAV